MAGEVLAGRPLSSANASWSPRSRITAMASIFVGLGGVVEVENDRGARLDQRPLDAGIGFLGDSLIERGQRIRILGLEDGLRGFDPLCRIGRQQREAAKRGRR